MSQAWESNTFAGTNVAQTDLQNIENNFATLKSCFSGTSAPANPVEGQTYRNTTYNNWRGYTGAAWVGLLSGSASFKVWVYMNAAETGWVVDSTVTDKVLSLKGGSTYTTGAATAGSWTVSGITSASHNHKVFESNPNTAADQVYNSGGTLTNLTSAAAGGTGVQGLDGNLKSLSKWINIDWWSENKTPAVNSDATWRPAAATGTLQYPDLT